MFESLRDRRFVPGGSDDDEPSKDQARASELNQPTRSAAQKPGEPEAARRRQVAQPRPTHPTVSQQLQMLARDADGGVDSARPKDGPEDKDGQRLVVGARIHLKGEVTNCDALIVEGHLEGSARSRIVQVAKDGSFIGEAEVETAEISGSFEGNLEVTSRLIIRSTGRVHGTIRYYAVEIEAGGQLAGDIQVSAERPSGRVKPGLTQAERHRPAGDAAPESPTRPEAARASGQD